MHHYGLNVSIDSVAALQQMYPDMWSTLEDQGYELASPNTLGCCTLDVTLFIEVDHVKGRAIGWVWLTRAMKFLGPHYEVRGPLGPAVAQAHHLLSDLLAEEQLSGGVPRYDNPPSDLSWVY